MVLLPWPGPQVPTTLRQCNTTASILLNKLKEAKADRGHVSRELSQQWWSHSLNLSHSLTNQKAPETTD